MSTPPAPGRAGRHAAAVVALIVLAALTLGCSGSDGEQRRSAGVSEATTTTGRAEEPCELEPSDTAPAGRSEHTIAAADGSRTYQLYVPAAGADPGVALPLVFSLHGYGSNGPQQLAYTGVEEVAETKGFVVVAPTAGGRPAHFDLYGMADVEFILAVLDAVATKVCVDPARVFSMGMSNGAAMSAVLACRAPDRFRAIGPVAAVVHSEEVCEDVGPTPIVAFMGTGDRVVPFEGGTVNCCGNPTIDPAPEAMAGWARQNGCDPEPVREELAPDVEMQRWTGCASGAETVFYVIRDGGHTWPGGIPLERLGHTTANISATRTILEFFEQVGA